MTDANVVLGYINGKALAGGGLPIRADLAAAVIRSLVAGPMGLSLEAAAWGVHRVANATMARALRAVSTERGRDPRELSILAFGGNGPVHAATLARLLDIRKILVPPAPGLFSALGMLFPEIEHHYVRTQKLRLEVFDRTVLDAAFGALVTEGAAALRDEGFRSDEHRFERLVDLRYVGANSELTLPFPQSGDVQDALRSAFDDAHVQRYGYRSDEESVEIMNVRVIARASNRSTQIPEHLSFSHGRIGEGGTRTVYFGPERGSIPTPVLARHDLSQAWSAGPLLVEEFDSTTVVPPDGRARRVAWDTMEIELE